MLSQPLARGKDMGNKVSIDMGNSFRFISRRFWGRDMEHLYSGGATDAVCEVGLEGPTEHVAVVPVFRYQSQVRLQMEAALRVGGGAGTDGSNAPSASLAQANKPGVVETSSAVATTSSELGQSQTAGSIGQAVPRARRSGGADDWRMAQEAEAQSPCSSAFLERAPHPAWEVDGGQAEQPSMDRGLQRVVSDARWKAGGTVDGPRSAQPLCAEHPVVARPKVGARETNLPASFWTLRLSSGDPRGQRGAVWIERSRRAFAIERLVDGNGDFAGVHCARPPRTEWGPRANAPSDEGGNDPPAIAHSARAAAPDRSLVACLQSDSPTRSTGAKTTGRFLPSRRATTKNRRRDLSPAVACSSGQEQWADQVARSKALDWGSLRWLSRRAQGGPEGLGSLLWQFADWRIARERCGRHASSSVCTPPVTSTRPEQTEMGNSRSARTPRPSGGSAAR